MDIVNTGLDRTNGRSRFVIYFGIVLCVLCRLFCAEQNRLPFAETRLFGVTSSIFIPFYNPPGRDKVTVPIGGNLA